VNVTGTRAIGLDALRDPDGWFRILAIDHRDSLRAFLAPDRPESVAAERITRIKLDLARAILPAATGVMLEPEYSIPQLLDADAVPDHVGFLAALEAQGYLDDPGAEPTRVLPGWSVSQAAASGAAAVKLLVPYHPDHPLAGQQEQVAATVLAECREVGIPLVLEPLYFGLGHPRERLDVVLRTAERFAGLGPDLLKLPFPVDPDADPDRRVWAQACDRLTERCAMPWALLSGGGSFDSFAAQVEVATAHGCHGFMVGRALWGEAARVDDADRPRVIHEIVLPRWRRLSEIAMLGSR
jgi:tagatose-1,6-bisphosphate aldolase